MMSSHRGAYSPPSSGTFSSADGGSSLPASPRPEGAGALRAQPNTHRNPATQTTRGGRRAESNNNENTTTVRYDGADAAAIVSPSRAGNSNGGTAGRNRGRGGVGGGGSARRGSSRSQRALAAAGATALQMLSMQLQQQHSTAEVGPTTSAEASSSSALTALPLLREVKSQSVMAVASLAAVGGDLFAEADADLAVPLTAASAKHDIAGLTGDRQPSDSQRRRRRKRNSAKSSAEEVSDNPSPRLAGSPSENAGATGPQRRATAIRQDRGGGGGGPSPFVEGEEGAAPPPREPEDDEHAAAVAAERQRSREEHPCSCDTDGGGEGTASDSPRPSHGSQGYAHVEGHEQQQRQQWTPREDEPPSSSSTRLHIDPAVANGCSSNGLRHGPPPRRHGNGSGNPMYNAGSARGYTYAFRGNELRRIAVDGYSDDDDDGGDGFIAAIRKYCRNGNARKNDVQPSTLTDSIGSVIKGAFFVAGVFLSLSLTDARRRKVSFCLGLSSVALVVFVTAILFTTLDNMNLIVLMLAEDNSGETDVVLTPGGQVSLANSLNYSVILHKFPRSGGGDEAGGGGVTTGGMGFGNDYSYHTPRTTENAARLLSPWAPPDAAGYCRFPPLEALPPGRRSTANVAQFLWTNSTQRWTGSVEDINDSEYLDEVREALCPLNSDRDPPAAIHWIDFAREERMGLGRSFPHAAARGRRVGDASDAIGGSGAPTTAMTADALSMADDECIVDTKVAAYLRLGVGDQFIAVIDLSHQLMEAYQRAGLADNAVGGDGAGGDGAPRYTSNPLSAVTLRVRAIVEEPFGKLPADNSFFVLANYRGLTRTVGMGLSTVKSTSAQREAFAAVDPNECAGRVIFNFPPDERKDIYIGGSYEAARDYGLTFAGSIADAVGFNQVDLSLPIIAYLSTYRFFSMFLSLLIWLVIAALAFLSVVLIYSLLTINVESRTYELGVMRMVGFQRRSLGGLVIVGALLFALPGWAIGLALGQAAYLGIRALLLSLVNTDLPMVLTTESVLWATLAGIAIPLVASVAPVSTVLTQSLSESLNTERGRTKGVDYKVEAASDSFFSWTAAGLGAVLTVYGFAVYYLFPKGLLNQDFSLMLVIFFLVLLMMLAGLVLLAMNFQRFVETVVQYATAFWEHAAVFLLVERNLTAHRARNRKASLMFALTLAFIIFIAVAFDVQFVSMTYAARRRVGGDVLIDVVEFTTDEFFALDELLRLFAADGTVEAHTYDTATFDEQPRMHSAELSTLGRFASAAPIIRGIGPNFFESTGDRFLNLHSQTSPTELSLSLGERLYTPDGSARLILPTTFVDSMALDNTSTVYEMNVKYYNEQTLLQYYGGGNGIILDAGGKKRDGSGTDPNAEADYGAPLQEVSKPRPDHHRRLPMRTVAFVDSAPVLTFSKFPQGGLVAGSQGAARQIDACIGVPAMIARSEGAIHSVRAVAMNVVSVSTFGDEAKAANVSAMVSYFIGGLPGAYGSGRVNNAHTQATEFDLAKTILDFFFYFTQILATAICFFSLLSSMSTSILHQAKEIGVLRSLGLGRFATYRMYMWEAFVVVLAASILGLVVGTIVAYTLLQQNALMTQLPLPFVFPFAQLVIMAILSAVCAFFASFGPVRALLSLPSITHILRRTI